MIHPGTFGSKSICCLRPPRAAGKRGKRDLCEDTSICADFSRGMSSLLLFCVFCLRQNTQNKRKGLLETPQITCSRIGCWQKAAPSALPLHFMFMLRLSSPSQSVGVRARSARCGPALLARKTEGRYARRLPTLRKMLNFDLLYEAMGVRLLLSV